jgi:formylglycine-generating enzyme required for sulfatase activity
MHRNFIILCCLMLVGLTACGSAFDDLSPTQVPGNTAWNPIVRSFDGVDMVWVPPGCFWMGHADGRRDEQPVHESCFENGFWIDRYEVTNGQYGSPGAFPGENRPRDNLTWFEARDFCAGRGARLPTEAEWEYAARGPDNLIYPWGDQFDDTRLVFDGNFEYQLWDVGSHPEGASWVGADDMSGNAWEWVSSIYRPYPYRAGDGREDLQDSTSLRVYRGGIGSYIDFGTSAATRFRVAPDQRGWFVGFRCARDE